MAKSFNVAIVGATGIVGGTLIEILEERKFPVDKLFLLASSRSAGSSISFKGKHHEINDVAEFDFSQTQLVFFCASNAVSEQYAPIAAAAGNVVIDKSSHFRYDNDVPLIVPEVNADALKKFGKKNIIANPNCSTIPIVVALKPIYDAVGISRINVATYQSVSGTGKEAISELADQTGTLLNGRPVKSKVYPQQIAFNVLPHCDDFMENGYTREEMKVIWETQKIFDDKKLMVNVTAVRVPVFYSHSAAVHIETIEKITAEKAIKILQKAPGIKVTSGKTPYSTPVLDATGDDAVFVGRVRDDLSHKTGLNFWVVSDNLRKGAALNATQIAENLIENYL